MFSCIDPESIICVKFPPFKIFLTLMFRSVLQRNCKWCVYVFVCRYACVHTISLNLVCYYTVINCIQCTSQLVACFNLEVHHQGAVYVFKWNCFQLFMLVLVSILVSLILNLNLNKVVVNQFSPVIIILPGSHCKVWVLGSSCLCLTFHALTLIISCCEHLSDYYNVALVKCFQSIKNKIILST